jgi:hypothetical protein
VISLARSWRFRVAAGNVAGMSYPFLSDAWFAEVDRLIADAGDLHIPAEMCAVEVNVTVRAPAGDTHVYIKDGLLTRGHRAGAATAMTLSDALARKIFVDADMAAGVQGFLTGDIAVEGDLARLVAMQTVEPSEAQKRLTRRIAAITA